MCYQTREVQASEGGNSDPRQIKEVSPRRPQDLQAAGVVHVSLLRAMPVREGEMNRNFVVDRYMEKLFGKPEWERSIMDLVNKRKLTSLGKSKSIWRVDPLAKGKG